MSHWKYTDTEYRKGVGCIGILERDDKCVLLDVAYETALTYAEENMERNDTYSEHNIYGVCKDPKISYVEMMLEKEKTRLFRSGNMERLEYLTRIGHVTG